MGQIILWGRLRRWSSLYTKDRWLRALISIACIGTLDCSCSRSNSQLQFYSVAHKVVMTISSQDREQYFTAMEARRAHLLSAVVPGSGPHLSTHTACCISQAGISGSRFFFFFFFFFLFSSFLCGDRMSSLALEIVEASTIHLHFHCIYHLIGSPRITLMIIIDSSIQHNIECNQPSRNPDILASLQVPKHVYRLRTCSQINRHHQDERLMMIPICPSI